MTKRLVELGGDVIPMSFEPEGMQSWSWADRADRMSPETLSRST